MIDKLIIKDINLTASNDDQYFVFEDVLYQVFYHLLFLMNSVLLITLKYCIVLNQVDIKCQENKNLIS